MKRRIAILYHETDRGQRLNYLIQQNAEIWRAEGHEVIPLIGTGQFIPAELLIVHVDLSVVPDEYLEFARRYPIVLNGAVKDIRKTTFSKLRVLPGDSHAGKVIVKSNLNYAGLPELQRATVAGQSVSPPPFRSPLDYRIFDHVDAVPIELRDHPDVIIEKFLPEMDNGQYVMRAMLFLGDRVTCARLVSDNPIVNGTTHSRMDFVEPHPDMVALRKTMSFDYGKFDYVIHDGQALLLDANKTPGAATLTTTPQMLEVRRYRAAGIDSYFPQTS